MLKESQQCGPSLPGGLYLRMEKHMKQTKAFYKDKKWQRKRLYILRRDGYKCQESKRYGQYSEATTVHHIYPLEDYPEISFEDWNLISMSGERHDTMHNRVTGKLTEKGMYWQNRRRKEFEEWKKRNVTCMEQK